jgi:hypothetical protein
MEFYKIIAFAFLFIVGLILANRVYIWYLKWKVARLERKTKQVEEETKKMKEGTEEIRKENKLLEEIWNCNACKFTKRVLFLCMDHKELRKLLIKIKFKGKIC